MLPEIIALVICLFSSIFFSATETAFTNLTLIQVQELKSSKKKIGRIVENLHNHPDVLLSTILLGNNIANVCISVLASIITIQIFGNFALGISTAIVTLIILLFGEILPKQYAIRNNMQISLYTARPIQFLIILFRPILKLIMLVPKLLFRQKNGRGMQFTPESILRMVDFAKDQGHLDEYKTQIVRSLFRFSNITVHAAMTHRKEVFSLDQELSVSEVIPQIVEINFSRIPIFADNSENINGIVNIKDILTVPLEKQADTRLQDLASDPVFFPETWDISRVFQRLRNERKNIGIVLDEYGGLAGVITLEDIIEQLIGELYDENDEPEGQLVHLSVHKDWYNVRGDAPIYLLEEILGQSIEQDRNSETAGGYVLRQISAFPKRGQRISTKIGTFIIQSVSKQQIQAMRYKPITDPH